MGSNASFTPPDVLLSIPDQHNNNTDETAIRASHKSQPEG